MDDDDDDDDDDNDDGNHHHEKYNDDDWVFRTQLRREIVVSLRDAQASADLRMFTR